MHIQIFHKCIYYRCVDRSFQNCVLIQSADLSSAMASGVIDNNVGFKTTVFFVDFDKFNSNEYSEEASPLA